MEKSLRINIVVILLFTICNGFAQEKFKFQTTTDSVVTDGFYKINLLPSIIAKARPTLDDIRLLDADGKQVPYIIKNNERVFDKTKYLPFKILERISEGDSISKLIIQNTDNQAIDNLVLTMQNSMANRNINISGSYDKKEWYAVKEFIGLVNQDNSSNDKTVQTIALPIIRYNYLLIVFNEKHQNPLLVNEVGTYKNTKQEFNYFPLPQPKIIQHDSSDKYSYIQLIYLEKYRIDKLQLFASGSKLYQREITFGDYKQQDFSEHTETLSSKNGNYFVFNFGKMDTLRFQIQNEDNPPLRIDSVKAFQDAYALFAYLKAGQKYKLTFGNNVINAPVYDLTAFKDSITTTTTLLNTGIITSNYFAPIVQPPASRISKIWLWVAIILVLGLLILFTASLLKQINKKAGLE